MIFMLMITHYLDTKDSMMKNTGLLKFGLSRGFLGSSFKCNTQRPQGIGCCDGHTIQAPQQRGTWRDFGGASARGEPWGDWLVAGA